MTAVNRTVIGAILLTLFAAAVGGWIGVHYGLRETRHTPDLDEFLHHALDLTDAQDQKIAALEAEFADRRKVLDSEMRGANRALASAIQADHTYGPNAQAAVERFHMAAAKLQEETIRHVLAMRAVLTPDQAQRFDAVVAKALTTDSP